MASRHIHLRVFLATAVFAGIAVAQPSALPAVTTSYVMTDSVVRVPRQLTDSVSDPVLGDSSIVDEPRVVTSGALGATVTVKGERRHKRKEISTSQLKREEFKKVVATAQDPLRALPTLPGVAMSSDLSVRPVVRGGDLTETGVQLDGAPLLMPYHFGSVFSVFHQEALEDFQLYSGVAPPQSEGRLSGSVVARSRSAPMDTLVGGADLSMMRGSAWLGVPLVKDKLGLWVSGQSVWYDWTIKRLMEFGELIGVAEGKEVATYKQTITLPTASDAQAGISWKPSRDWNLDLSGFVAKDEYRSLERLTTCWAGDMEVPCYGSHICYADQVPTYPYLCSTGQKIVEKRNTYDTIAVVNLWNWMASGRVNWSPDRDLSVDASFSAQQVDWTATFPGSREFVYENGKYRVVRADAGDKFGWNRIALDGQISARRRWNESHETSMGFGLDRGEERVGTHLDRVAAQLILGTTGNPLEYLGLYNENEILVKNDGLSDYVDLDRLASLDFNYASNTARLLPAAWMEHRWDPDAKTRVRAGLRLQAGSDGGSVIPNPRLQVQRQVTDLDMIGLGLALHTQSELPFEWKLAAPKKLESEKAWLGIVEWEHQFAPGWRTTVSGWGKIYRDLASPNMAPTSSIDSSSYFDDVANWISMNRSKLDIPDSVFRYSYVGWDPSVPLEENLRRDDSVRLVYQRRIASYAPASVAADIAWWNQERKLEYASTGEGWATGLEASLRFQPTPGWSGWASLEWCMSRRKDRDDGIWYPFGLERPWKISLVNSFRIDKKWELSVRYAATGGNPYTPFEYRDSPIGASDRTSDTLLWIGSRNSADLAPYQRLDLRVSRESRMFGLPTTFYYEIWNALNDPNAILRDSRTGEFRMVQYNMPIPVIFLGMEVRI